MGNQDKIRSRLKIVEVYIKITWTNNKINYLFISLILQKYDDFLRDVGIRGVYYTIPTRGGHVSRQPSNSR